MLLQETNELARQSHEEVRRLDIRREPSLVRVVEDDDVDVAGIIELVAAELAHGNDEIAAWRRGRRADDLAGCACPAEEKLDRMIDRLVGGDAHGAQRLFRRPDPAKIGKSHEERDPPLVAPERGHDLLRRFRRFGRGAELGASLFEMEVGIAQ